MLQEGTESYLIVQGRPLKWSPAGYRAAADAIWGPMLLTPPSTLRALAAGYVPVLHPSAVELMSVARRHSGARVSANPESSLLEALHPGSLA